MRNEKGFQRIRRVILREGRTTPYRREKKKRWSRFRMTLFREKKKRKKKREVDNVV